MNSQKNMTRTNNRAIFFGIILLGLALFFGKSETFALVGDLEFSPPELIINVSYSEPTDDHSITIYIYKIVAANTYTLIWKWPAKNDSSIAAAPTKGDLFPPQSAHGR